MTGSQAIIFTEERFFVGTDGALYSPSGYGTAFWLRYLSVFDRVAIAARVSRSEPVPAGAVVVDDDRVCCLELPYYVGVKEYLSRWIEVRAAVSRACDESGVPIVRLPGQIGNLAVRELIRRDARFGVELVGDPEDVFDNGGAGGWLSGYLSRSFRRSTQRACLRAAAVSYVTEHTLQRRYPGSDGAGSASYSSIVLPQSSIRDASRTTFDRGGCLRLISVGSLEHMTKGMDTLIRAVASLGDHARVRLSIVGEGRCRGELVDLARALGCSESVRFLGRRDNAEVFGLLDSHDVFVLASRGEGLPRVIIEAMARAMPVIATRVSGIPELVPEPWLVPVDDHRAIASLVERLAQDPATLDAMSRKNLDRARHFESDRMQSRREGYYRMLTS